MGIQELPPVPTMIIVIGHNQDAVSLIVTHALRERGASVCLLDTHDFPKRMTLSYESTLPTVGEIRWVDGSHPPIAFSDIRSIFLCREHGFSAPQEQEERYIKAVASNLQSAWISFCKMQDCLFVNPVHTTQDHYYKPYLLKALQAKGIRIPQTLITNEPQQVRDFYQRMNGHVIFKPVYGWGYTAPLTEADLTDERLSALSNLPYTFQEKIEGTDIRVYKVGNQLFPVEIQSDDLDFRTDEDAKRVPITLPDEVAAHCHLIGQTLDLMYTGIDMRRTPEGEYVFLRPIHPPYMPRTKWTPATQLPIPWCNC